MNPEFDILILGGGLVGCSVACALEGRGYRTGMVEASLPSLPPPGFDERKLALAAASINALGALGVLAELAVVPSPIRRIHVSRAGDFGSVRLEASDSGRDSFGSVVSARELGLALERRLSRLTGLRVLRPCTVSALTPGEESIAVTVQREGKEETLSTRLLVGADGTRSFARAALGIELLEHDYGQTLIVCSVACERAADGMAYERFTEHGPVALLPIGSEFGSVCAVPREAAATVMAMDDLGYRDYFQQRLGWRAGRIERVGRRSASPVAQLLAERVIAHRAVLVGNAAQTIHPIGAQGFNLGLRDALCLSETLEGADSGSAASLSAYVESRREDREQTLAFSDGLARLTSNPAGPMRLLRSLGLLAMANVPGLAGPLASGAMGFRGRVPRLARGPA